MTRPFCHCCLIANFTVLIEACPLTSTRVGDLLLFEVYRNGYSGTSSSGTADNFNFYFSGLERQIDGDFILCTSSIDPLYTV